MNKLLNLTHTGGFPLDQGTLDFMQQSFSFLEEMAKAIAGTAPCIVSGCEVVGATTTAGVVIINGEVLPFEAGPTGAKVAIIETVETGVFEDLVTRDIEMKRKVAFSALGLDWADFKRIVPMVSMFFRGMVINYYGSVVDIPAGWLLCDGSNGTPDMRKRFVVGLDTSVVSADTDFDTIGKVGGAKTFTLVANQLPVISPWSISQTPHSHKTKSKENQNSFNSGFNAGTGAGSTSAIDSEAVNANITQEQNTGGGQPVNKLPPFYTLAFIMKA